MKRRIDILVTILALSFIFGFFFITQGQILAKENSKKDYNLQESRANVSPDSVKIAEMDGRQYREIYMTSYKLTRKFGTGLDLSRYKGFYYQEVLPDIYYIADSIAADPLVDSVQVLDSLRALIWITKDDYILKYGEEGLNPEDGEYCGYRLYILPMPAPYLPIYPDYPKNKPEIMSYRTPYSRTFNNSDGIFSTILTIRPTSYRVKEGGEVNWIDMPPDEPIPECFARAQVNLDVTDYGIIVELDNDGLSAYNFIYGGSSNYGCNVGAGQDLQGIHKHLYQRECSQFSTVGFPPYSGITGVTYRTYVTSYYPEDYQINPDGTYDYYEIWPLMKKFYHKISDYSNGNYNALYDDIGDGFNYYNGGGWIWERSSSGFKYANFNYSGGVDFVNRISTGFYSTGLKDSSETGNSSPLYWEAIVTAPTYDQMQITYIPSGVENSQPSESEKTFNLSQNFPNPVFSRTVIKYALAKKSKVELKIYDATGREIANLLNKEQNSGHYKVNWDIKDVSKKRFPNGVYFYRLRAGNFTEAKKMVVVR